MCLICKKKRELNIYISGMTDLEFKLLFYVMAGCGYKLFLSTEYKLLDIWHDSFLPHVCKCFMNICMKQFTFFLFVTFPWWTNPLEWHKLNARYLASQILEINKFYILQILHIWHWQIWNKSYLFLLNTSYLISGMTDFEHKLAFFHRQTL